MPRASGDAIEHYTKALAYAEPLAEAAFSPDEDHPVEPEAISMASVLFSNRALAHLKRAEHRHAVDDCDKALALDPGAVKALFRRGTALAKMKRWEHAKADLAQVVEKSPEDKKAKVSWTTLLACSPLSWIVGGSVRRS